MLPARGFAPEVFFAVAQYELACPLWEAPVVGELVQPLEGLVLRYQAEPPAQLVPPRNFPTKKGANLVLFVKNLLKRYSK